PVSYNNPSAQKLDVTYIAFVPLGMSIRERTDNSSWRNAESRNWTMRTFDGDHVVYRSRPAEIAELLEIAIKDRNQP
ncbi:MAG: alpha/beta hydrolase, partial [Anaerolineae bacterium]|nr:alpha/beta hydrolase [Anaerolineae bacterium]